MTALPQPELFSAVDLAQPARPRPPRPEPNPRWLRRHLTEMLAELRFCISMPWPDYKYEMQNDLFVGMARRLGPDEGPTWLAQWEAEIARLRQGAPA